MGFLGFGGGGEYLAVDFGASAIKIAKAKFPSSATAEVGLVDKEPVHDVPPDEFPEECSRVLKLLVDRNNISGKLNVVLALPSNSVIVRRMELPAMPDDRMSKVIRYEAESHIPFPLDQVVIDHHIIDKTEDGTELILTAVKKDKLDEYLDVIYGAGLNPAIIDVAAFSLFNLFQYLEGTEDEKQSEAPVSEGEGEDNRVPAKAIVDVGHGNTDIVVARGRKLYFARSASVAGESITAEIAKRMDVELEEAEELKLEHGHVPLGESAAPEESMEEGTDALSELAAERRAQQEEKEETEEETEASEDETAMAEGLSLGTPRAPDKEDSEPEEATPAPPVAPEKDDEEEDESQGLGLGTPRAPDKKDTEQEEAPPASSVAPEEEEDESQGLSLGTPRSPEKKDTEPEEATPAPPVTPEKDDEEDDESQGLGLGTPRAPDKKEDEEQDDTEHPQEEKEISTSGLGSAAKKNEESGAGGGLTGTGMLKGAMETDEDEEEAEGPSLLGSSEKSSSGGLLGSDKKDNGDDDKNSLGAAANNSDAEPTENDEQINAIGAAVKPQVDRLIGELRHTFDYFQSQLDGGEIGEVILSGGTSKLKNLPIYISEQLGYPVRRFNPVKQINGCKENMLQEMLVSIGLQLRVVPEKAILNVNLVPPDIINRRRAQTQKQKITVLSVLGGIFLVLLLSAAALLYMGRLSEIQKSEEQIEQLRPIVEQVDTLEETQDEVQQRLTTIENLENEKAEILSLLYEINRLPDDLRERTVFRSMNFARGNPGQLDITGTTGDFDDASRLFRWLENRTYILRHESESMSRQSYQIDGREVSMIDFSAQYSVSFVDG